MGSFHPAVPARTRRRSVGRGALLGALLLAAGAPGAFAQRSGDSAAAFRTTAEGISAGRFLLFPSVTMDSGYDSNVFYQSDEIPGSELVSSGELILTPKIMVDLPLSRSRARVAYALQYRDYSSNEFVQSEPFSHFFDLEASVRVGDLVTLFLKDHYVRGTQDVQQFDPGGEIRFGVTPFSLSEPSAAVSLTLAGRHRISLVPYLSTLNFDQTEAIGFYDYEKRGLTGRYDYQLDPATVAFGTYSSEDTDQKREVALFGDINVRTHYAGAGLQRTFGAAVASSAWAGYETQDYEGGSGGNFSGMVYDVSLTWTASDVYYFQLTANRQPYQSFFVNNNYYVGNSFRLRMTQQFGRNAFYQVGLGLQRNPYADPVDIRVTPATPPGSDLDNDGLIDVYESLLPSQGTVRTDKAYFLELGAGIRLSPMLRFSLGYNHEVRDSNIEQIFGAGTVLEPFDFDVDRVFFRIEAGIL